MTPAEQRAKNTDRNNPNEIREEQNNGGGSLQYPLDLDSEYEGYYVEFAAFDYQKGLQGNDLEARSSGSKVPKEPERIRLPITGNIQSNYNAAFNDFQGSFIYDALMEMFNYNAEDAVNKIGDYAGKLLSDPLSPTLPDEFTAAKAESIFGQARAQGERNLLSIGGFYADQLSASRGNIINPRMQSAFEGVGIREHQYEFLMIPRSSKEAQAIEEIIKKFKTYMHPAGGRQQTYLQYPKEWTIGFYNAKSGDHVKMPSIPDSFLTSVNVVYNPEGIAKFYKDDYPFSAQMSLQFKEANMLTREDIESEGY